MCGVVSRRESAGIGSSGNTSKPAPQRWPAIERVANGVVIDKRAARAVDEHRPGGHRGELFPADHALGFGRGPRVQGNDARAGKQFAEFDILCRVSQGLRLYVGIIHKHVTPEAAEHPGHAAADRAVADQPGGGILQLQSALSLARLVSSTARVSSYINPGVNGRTPPSTSRIVPDVPSTATP
jgi:hypothetical protein